MVDASNVRRASGQSSGNNNGQHMSLPELTTTHLTTSSAGLVLPTYIDFIKWCYQNHPEAFSYYEQLVDYLEPCSSRKTTPNYPPLHEKPKLFEAWLPASTLPGPYPAAFPFEALEWEGHSERPRAAILEGFPSPAAVLRLGSRWNLRPEFFIGHIFASSSNNQRAGFYGHPTLPSRQDNIMRIQFTSLVKSLVEGPSVNSYLEKRLEVEEACRQYEKELFAGKHYETTRFREINQHDTYYCSVEQTISFTVVVGDRKPWVAVYLVDHGRSMLNNIRLPWTSYSSSGTPIGTLPIVPYNAPLTQSPLEYKGQRDSQEIESTSRSYGQFHPLRNVVVQDNIDMRLLSEDPFFLLASLLTTSALSFVQLLNYLSESIAECRTINTELLNFKLERLRHCVSIIHRIELSLTENLHWIKQGGSAEWPKARSAETSARKALLQQKLCKDHEHLLQRCSIMQRDCESATFLPVSYSQLLCAEQGIAQAAEVHRLTKLASFFVPLGFAATAFGMNIKELQNFPSVWVFFVVAIGVSSATFTLMYWSSRQTKKLSPGN